MFKPTTKDIQILAKIYPKRIKELKTIFRKRASIYIDFANVYHWQEKLKWHIDLKRLKRLFDSFKTVRQVRFYNGVLPGDEKSERIIKTAEKLGYIVTSKPVKKMQLSIDVSGIPKNSPAVLQKFIKKSLLRKFSIETIEYLNTQLEELNKRGIKTIEHWKCNFDVEIGRDMLIDHQQNKIDSFVLWSGDSDFEEPVKQLLKDKKFVAIFATARRISPELASTGALIFELWKIKDFICWSSEMSKEVKTKLRLQKQKGLL